MEIEIEGSQGKLACYISQSSSKAKHAGQGSEVLIATFGLPIAKPLLGADLFHKELVERLANQSGWTVLSLLCSGIDGSAGRFSPSAWCQDVETAAEYLVQNNKIESVLLAGYDFMADICLYVASRSSKVRGVATVSPLLSLSTFLVEPRILAARAQKVGVKVEKEDAELENWRGQLEALDFAKSADGLGSKQWLLIHGRDDEVVREAELRDFLITSGGAAEAHVLSSGDHHLLSDPRMMAILLGWMERNN